MSESEDVPSPAEFARAANVSGMDAYRELYERAAQQSGAVLGGVGEQANCPGSQAFDQTLEWDPPFAKWFVGGKINACYNCVDRHRHDMPQENEAGDSLGRRTRRSTNDHI